MQTYWNCKRWKAKLKGQLRGSVEDLVGDKNVSICRECFQLASMPSEHRTWWWEVTCPPINDSPLSMEQNGNFLASLGFPSSPAPLTSIPHTATGMVLSKCKYDLDFPLPKAVQMLALSASSAPASLSRLIFHPFGVQLYWLFSPFNVPSQGLCTCSSSYWEWAFPPFCLVNTSSYFIFIKEAFI